MGWLLEGKRALIVGGGGGGIGRAITRAFTAAGSALAVVDVDPQRADEAAAEASAAGIEAFALVGDVRSRADSERVVGEAVRELGALDILVTVVGGQLAFVPAARVHEITDEDWDLMFRVNLHYVAHAVRATLREFLGQGPAGRSSASARSRGSPAAPRRLRTAPRRRAWRASPDRSRRSTAETGSA